MKKARNRVIISSTFSPTFGSGERVEVKEKKRVEENRNESKEGITKRNEIMGTIHK